MKLVCPCCGTRYSIDPERLEGRTARIRCKRCGESFRVSGEVSDPARAAAVRPLEDRRAGERNESSVLFSLAMLSKTAPAAVPQVTESSSLIDLRALTSAMAKADSPTSQAADIVNLSGGGAFASGFASPLAAPSIPVDAPTTEATRTRTSPVMVAAIAFAAVALVGAVTFASTRAMPTARLGGKGVAPVTAAASPAVTAETNPEPSAVAPEPPTSPVAPASSTAAPPARTTRTTESRPVPSSSSASVATPTTPVTPAKCCPGESETVCQMRLSVGAACGADRTTSSSTITSAPPFDRPSAARALGVSVATCKRAGGPTGAGHVRVTFQPSGAVSAVDVEPPFAGTPTGACIAQRYRSASVPAFSGGALTVGKGFAIE